MVIRPAGSMVMPSYVATVTSGTGSSGVRSSGLAMVAAYPDRSAVSSPVPSASTLNSRPVRVKGTRPP